MTAQRCPEATYTTVRCPTKRFRTRRYAARYAWALEPNPTLRPVPAQCDDCGAFHLVAPEPATTHGRI